MKISSSENEFLVNFAQSPILDKTTQKIKA
jgi:hypothetical protein